MGFNNAFNSTEDDYKWVHFYQDVDASCRWSFPNLGQTLKVKKAVVALLKRCKPNMDKL